MSTTIQKPEVTIKEYTKKSLELRQSIATLKKEKDAADKAIIELLDDLNVSKFADEKVNCSIVETKTYEPLFTEEQKERLSQMKSDLDELKTSYIEDLEMAGKEPEIKTRTVRITAAKPKKDA